MTADVDRTVIVVAKEPVPGRVKTRLCPPCTPAEAASLAEAALLDTIDVALASSADRVVLVLDGDRGSWVPGGVEVIEQRSGPFGDRLDRAWADSIGARPGPSVQVGMDTPQLSVEHLDLAIDALDEHAAVLGEALDGGWWGLGLRAHLPGAFVGVPMSDAQTGRRQRERLTELLGTVPHPLPLLRDVDHMTDAVAVAAEAPDGRFAAAVRALAHG